MNILYHISQQLIN